jgi:hypothetical protein
VKALPPLFPEVLRPRFVIPLLRQHGGSAPRDTVVLRTPGHLETLMACDFAGGTVAGMISSSVSSVR